METISSDLTQLENELYEKVKKIKKHFHDTKYNPKRVEPGIDFDLEVESKWSKFSGETLFINQKLLHDVHYRNAIFWREALLLFAPKQMRDTWWVRLIANAYPLSVKLTSIEQEQWENLWRETSSDLLEYIQNCKRLISSAGSHGLIEVLKQGLYQTLYQHEELGSRSLRSNSVNDLDPNELKIILTNGFLKSVNISKKTVDIMNLALIKQTSKTKELEKNLPFHHNTIAKTVKKLLDMNILQHNYFVNYHALGLSQYIVLLICTKKQRAYYKTPIKNPFLYSHKYNCLNTCVINQHYVGPKTKEYYNLLINYCQKLEKKNLIVDFFVFELLPLFRSYWLKYFNTKTKSLDFNLNDVAIESDLFDSDSFEVNRNQAKTLENIIVSTRIRESQQENIDILDLKILNQFMFGIYNRRIIQKNIKKDMNEISQRIKKLFANNLIFENIQVVLPRSDGELAAYVEINPNKKSKNHRYLQERLIKFSYYLPHVYCGEIKGTFNGLLLLSKLPSSITMELADLFNGLLPDSINTQIIVGKPVIQKIRDKIDENRWNNGHWIVSEEDFEI